MLGSAHLLIIAAIVAALVALLLFAIRRSRGQFAVKAARVIAALYIVFAVISTIAFVAQALDPNSSVPVTLPVQEFWPTLPAGAHVQGPTAHVTGGGFTSAQVSVSGLDAAARVWLALDHLLQGATSIVIGTGIVVLSSSILKASPFRPALTRAVATSAIAIIVGGLLWQVCGGIGGWLASEQTLRLHSSEFATRISIDDLTHILGIAEPSGGSMNVDLWPIGIGLALLALSAVFRRGILLQKDTEGLV